MLSRLYEKFDEPHIIINKKPAMTGRYGRIAATFIITFCILPFIASRLTESSSPIGQAHPTHLFHPRLYHADDQYLAFQCVYPLCGAYSRFQRLLYYLVMIFTFVFRFHQGLTTAGLAFILTYSGSAAIHGFFLAFAPTVGSDMDQLFLTSLVGISLYATSPQCR